MFSSLFRIGAFGTALFSGAAGAMGFGDIVLRSAVGEPLRAEVPIFLAPGETLEGACFSLANIHGADLPVVASARLQLERHGSQARLTISGRQPITEPVFIIALRAHCGVELQRDYTLMPAPPLQQANPGLADNDAPGAASGAARRPPPARLSAKSGGTSAASPTTGEASPPRKSRTKPLPAVAARAPDRIVLGAPPDENDPKPPPARGLSSNEEERLRKLESTLQQLNQEVDKLNGALALATEALAVQQQLMNAQNRPSAPASLRAAPPMPTAPVETGRGNWLELLLSALLGGGFVAGVAHLLGRRPPPQAAPPLLPPPRSPATAPRPPTAPASAAPPASTAPAAAAPAVDIPLDDRPLHSPPEAVTVAYNDSNSAVELAEIMLSFGRLHGAAETLSMHIEENSPDNIQPWLMLLDLYRRGDMRSEFEALAGQMQRRFNARLPAWEESPPPVSGLKSLEDYAHVAWRCANCWGSQECMDYLCELVLDDRAGSRSGFPLEVIEEIVLLMHLLESGYGLRRPDG